MKKKEFREPEGTTKAYAHVYPNGTLAGQTFYNYGPLDVEVRIVRERDYQRLLRAAKGGGRKR